MRDFLTLANHGKRKHFLTFHPYLSYITLLLMHTELFSFNILSFLFWFSELIDCDKLFFETKRKHICKIGFCMIIYMIAWSKLLINRVQIVIGFVSIISGQLFIISSNIRKYWKINCDLLQPDFDFKSFNMFYLSVDFKSSLENKS